VVCKPKNPFITPPAPALFVIGAMPLIPQSERAPRSPATFKWDVLMDVCIYDLDYLKTFIRDYAPGRERSTS
jgi:hypothetical protein